MQTKIVHWQKRLVVWRNVVQSVCHPGIEVEIKIVEEEDKNNYRAEHKDIISYWKERT